MRHNTGDPNIDDALELVDQGILRILDDGVVIRYKRKPFGRRADGIWHPCTPKIVSSVNGKGYLYFGWKDDDGRRRSVRLNRLVYAYFKGPLHSGFEVHHADNIKTNNHPNNLSEVTHLENMQRATIDGLRHYRVGIFNPAVKVTQEIIEKTCDLLNNGKSCTQAARALGIGVNIVRNMAYGKTWQHLLCVQNLKYKKHHRRTPVN